MSGPVTTRDVPPDGDQPAADPPEVEVTESREAQVGVFTVRRALPRRGRRTVGAWCFVDHMGPAQVTEDRGIDVGPHPHIGLQTATWLLEGEGLHRDSVGSEQVLRPGQLNLMTAGRGVSHSEEATGTYRGALHGVQLWIAQPEETRHGDPAFEHHADLPRVDLGGADATVFVGTFGDVRSPARRDTDHVGVDLDLRAGTTTVPLDPAHEHAVVLFDGEVTIDGRSVRPGHLAYLGLGRDELGLRTEGGARALLIGGVPFPEPVLMWWNYVARTQAEITEAHRSWTAGDERFGTVASPLGRIDTGPPPWDR
jgi:redox-sensitive bicupin YhaK (pirin superfamily)